MGRKHRVMPRDLHQILQSLHEQQSAIISANEERELLSQQLVLAAMEQAVFKVGGRMIVHSLRYKATRPDIKTDR